MDLRVPYRRSAQNLSLKTALKHALNPLAPIGDQNFGVTNLGGEHYLIGTSPIDLQGYVIGTLTLGDRIDSSFLPNLRAFFGGSIVVTVGGQLIASTLPQTSGDNSAVEILGRLGSETLTGGRDSPLGRRKLPDHVNAVGS